MLQVLAVLAGALHLVAYYMYFRDVKSPSRTTWIVWGMISVLNFATFHTMSGRWTTSVMPAVSAFAAFGLMIVSMVKGSYTKVKWVDLVALVLGFIAACFWIVAKSTGVTYASAILLLAILIGFVPQFRGMYDRTVVEQPAPWFCWTFAFLIGLATVRLSPEPKPMEYIYYSTLAIAHGAVGIYSIHLKRPKPVISHTSWSL